MALTDPIDTLAYHGARVLCQHRDMSAVDCASVAKAMAAYMKVDQEKGTVPEREALWFYGMNHGMALIASKFAPLEPLPEWELGFVKEYHEKIAKKSIRAFYYLLWICIREARHNGSLKDEKKTEGDGRQVRLGVPVVPDQHQRRRVGHFDEVPAEAAEDEDRHVLRGPRLAILQLQVGRRLRRQEMGDRQRLPDPVRDRRVLGRNDDGHGLDARPQRRPDFQQRPVLWCILQHTVPRPRRAAFGANPGGGAVRPPDQVFRRRGPDDAHVPGQQRASRRRSAPTSTGSRSRRSGPSTSTRRRRKSRRRRR